MVNRVIIFIIQFMYFDGYCCTNSSNLQLLLQSKMSRITKRSLSESKKSYRMLKNEDIESKKLIPMEIIFANQLLLGKPNGFRTKNNRKTGSLSKNDHESKYVPKEGIYNKLSKAPKAVDTSNIIDSMSRKSRHVHQNKIDFERRNDYKRISIYNKIRNETKLL